MCQQATKLLIAASPQSPELNVLDEIKGIAHTVGIGSSVKELPDMSDDDWASVEVLLICGVGDRAAKKADIQDMWPKLKGLKWTHSASAGLDALLFRELIDSDVTLTNARGVYSHSLAEYALACCSWFAKDLPRMRAAQQAKQWDQYDVEELRGKTMGMIGYGDIARSTARLAKAFKMRVIATRRRAQLSEEDTREGILSEVFSNEQLPDMVTKCDYIVMATPFTEQTHKLFGEEAVGAMKSNAVFVNIGRGKCCDEPALVAALQKGQIRGAGLDVFYTEPLPEDSPLWELDNVFMSAHTADRTKEFQTESMQFFCKNMQAYVDSTQELENVVDKEAGY